MTFIPPDHPKRLELNDEVHARPPERLTSPARVSYMALLADAEGRRQIWKAVAELAEAHGQAGPRPDAVHFSAPLGRFRITAERHTEFVRLTFIAPGFGAGGEADPFADPAILAAPSVWVADLPGELITATHAAILRAGETLPKLAAFAGGVFAADGLIGADIAGGAGAAFTDLRVRGDRFGRLVIFDRGLTPGQTGRALARLLEMDTYRMLALLAYPVARALTPVLTGIETELASITAALVDATEADEAGLLDRLTRLAAQAESRQSDTLFRFSASISYYDLVQRRIGELREVRIEGLQTFNEFAERRLAPAIATCRAVRVRQEQLSVRVAQAANLLSIRVELSSERQSHALLESMNRRAQLQLRLQETVEGLSVAAITYYVVSLVGHAAEALDHFGIAVSPALAMGIAIPVVAGLITLAVRRVRRRLSKSH